MIEGDQQYRVAQEQLQRFESALASIRERPIERRLKQPRLRQAEEDGIASLVEELREDISNYEFERTRNDFAVRAQEGVGV